MEKHTISSAIVEVLKKTGRPLNPKEIYEGIRKSNLVQFGAKHPEGVVRTQLRRHAENVHLPASSKVKYVISNEDGTYWLKGVPLPKS